QYMSLLVLINTKISPTCQITIATSAPTAAPVLCSQAGAGMMASKITMNTGLAPNARIAMGNARSRWIYQTTATNNQHTVDRAQTIRPATNDDNPASNDSTSVNTTGVRIIASRVGQVAWSNIPHQPFLFTVFLATSFTVFCWAICWTLVGFCRSHFIEFAIVGTTSNPRPQGQ